MYSKINKFLPDIDDHLDHIIAKRSMKSGELRNNLTEGIYIPKDQDQALARLENALLLFEKSEMVIARIKKAIKENLLPNDDPYQLIDLAIEKHIIDKQDKEIVEGAKNAVYDAVQVDEYTLEEYNHTRS